MTTNRLWLAVFLFLIFLCLLLGIQSVKNGIDRANYRPPAPTPELKKYPLTFQEFFVKYQEAKTDQDYWALRDSFNGYYVDWTVRFVGINPGLNTQIIGLSDGWGQMFLFSPALKTPICNNGLVCEKYTQKDVMVITGFSLSEEDEIEDKLGSILHFKGIVELQYTWGDSWKYFLVLKPERTLKYSLQDSQ